MSSGKILTVGGITHVFLFNDVVCDQCKFAHELHMKLYTCDDDLEPIIYCDKHEVICRARRPACDWYAVDHKV